MHFSVRGPGHAGEDSFWSRRSVSRRNSRQPHNGTTVRRGIRNGRKAIVIALVAASAAAGYFAFFAESSPPPRESDPQSGEWPGAHPRSSHP